MKIKIKCSAQKARTKQFAFLFLFNLFALMLLCLSPVSSNAQENRNAPEMEVAGIRLNDAESGKTFLSKYAPRTGENGQPVYYFYNKYATEVMKLTAFSEKQPYLIIGAEVYSVGKSYREQHFQINEIGSFATESNFFVGVRQSAKSLLFGVAEKTDTEKIIKLKGKPDENTKDDKKETLVYRLNDFENSGRKIRQYTAVYEFNKGKMKKFGIRIEPANEL